MKYLTLLFVLGIGLSFAACKGGKESRKNGDETAEAVTTSEESEEACLPLTRGEGGKMDHYNVEDAVISSNCLRVRLNYSGGCRDHKFSLIWTGAYTKSIPPQVNLSLTHDSDGDVCRQMLMKDLAFDLTDLQMENQKEIRVNLILPNKGKQFLDYVYR